MYRKVLLAYDGSVEGRTALREGARLAQICGAEVFLLAVADISTGMLVAEGFYPGGVVIQREAFESVLAEGVQRLRAMGFSPKARLESGDPGEQIEAVVKEIGADLVVVGHRHYGALTRWWMGSVGKHLIDHVDCSVLVARMEIDDAEFASMLRSNVDDEAGMTQNSA